MARNKTSLDAVASDSSSQLARRSRQAYVPAMLCGFVETTSFSLLIIIMAVINFTVLMLV